MGQTKKSDEKICMYEELLRDSNSVKEEQIKYQVKDTKFVLKGAINNQEKRVNELTSSLVVLRASYPMDFNAVIKAKANLKVAEMTLESAKEEYTFLFGEEYSD